MDDNGPHADPMFERFTDYARHVIVLAQEEARRLKHNYIGTEHLLLGLLAEQRGIAAQALERCGLSLESCRQEVRARVGDGKAEMSSRHIPFTPRAKKALELSLREALALHHTYIGTEHLLLGLMREASGLGSQILANQAGDLLTVRMAVLDLLPTTPPAVAERQRAGFLAEEIPPASWPPLYRGRRWRLRSESAPAGEPAPVRTSPAAATTLDEAARLAGAQPVGSHHLLLAALADPGTAVARTLAGLGVDLEKAREALRHADVTGTSDEPPEQRGRRQMLIRVDESRLTIEVTDPEIVGRGRAALGALAEQSGEPGASSQPGRPGEPGQLSEPGTIRGDLPVSASLGAVWEALHESLADIRRRAAVSRADAEAGGGPGGG